MDHKRSFLTVVFFVLISVWIVPTIGAEEPPKAAAKGPSEKTVNGDFDPVWDKVVETLTEKGLAVHPHGKMVLDKEAGKITTPTFRYFKIYSAKPVKEIDYRDTYTILVSKAAPSAGAEASEKGKGKMVKIQIQRKFEVYDDAKKSWVDGDPGAEKVGITEEALLNALDKKLVAAAEPPKPAAEVEAKKQ